MAWSPETVKESLVDSAFGLASYAVSQPGLVKGPGECKWEGKSALQLRPEFHGQEITSEVAYLWHWHI